ncbi:MAG: hypothetical protein ACK448_07530 [Bacteroidota bacterium]|jgi:hypothetical protein
MGIRQKSLFDNGFVYNRYGLLICLLISIGLASCTLEKQYHSEGYRVTWNSELQGAQQSKQQAVVSKSNSGFNPKTDANGRNIHKGQSQSTQLAARSHALSKVNSVNDSFQSDIDSMILEKYRRMDVPLEYLTNYSAQMLLLPYFRHDSIIRPHKLVSVYTRDNVFVGKLMAVTESGVFILNNKKPFSILENLESSRDQKRIMGKLCYIPYSQIRDIHKGATFWYKLQIILEPFFQTISLLIVFALSIITLFATIKSGGASSGDSFEVLLLIFFFIGMVIAALFCFVLALIIAPPIWVLHHLLRSIPRRYWLIKGDSYRGEQFFKAMMRSPRKLKIIRK